MKLTRFDKAFLAVCAIAVLACASGAESDTPFKRDVTIENDYAESLFSLSLLGGADGGETVLLTDERVDGSSRRTFEDLIPGNVGDPITIKFSGMSLGERREFPPLDVTIGSSALLLVYDYDLATANFTISSSWAKR